MQQGAVIFGKWQLWIISCVRGHNNFQLLYYIWFHLSVASLILFNEAAGPAHNLPLVTNYDTLEGFWRNYFSLDRSSGPWQRGQDAHVGWSSNFQRIYDDDDILCCLVCSLFSQISISCHYCQSIPGDEQLQCYTFKFYFNGLRGSLKVVSRSFSSFGC